MTYLDSSSEGDTSLQLPPEPGSRPICRCSSASTSTRHCWNWGTVPVSWCHRGPTAPGDHPGGTLGQVQAHLGGRRVAEIKQGVTEEATQ